MDKRESATVGWMILDCAGDTELGIPKFRKKFMLSLRIEDDNDLEKFRADISKSFATVLGDKVSVKFDFEIEGQVVEFDEGGKEAIAEPGIGKSGS